MFSGSSGVNYSNGAIKAKERLEHSLVQLTVVVMVLFLITTAQVYLRILKGASEVRAHLTANKGLSVSSGEFNIDSANVKGMFSVSDVGGDGSLAYNSSNGTFTYTGRRSASEVRVHLTANKVLVYLQVNSTLTLH